MHSSDVNKLEILFNYVYFWLTLAQAKDNKDQVMDLIDDKFMLLASISSLISSYQLRGKDI